MVPMKRLTLKIYKQRAKTESYFDTILHLLQSYNNMAWTPAMISTVTKIEKSRCVKVLKSLQKFGCIRKKVVLKDPRSGFSVTFYQISDNNEKK